MRTMVTQPMLATVHENAQNLLTSYERAAAGYLGVRHAIAFAYARTALVCILSSLGVKPGDAVILSPLTCKVVPLALLALRLKPVYADISADTLNLAPQGVEAAIEPRTHAILFQHTYGHSAGASGIAEIAKRHQLPLIEDCAQCIPLVEEGNALGQWGEAAIFSNNLRKPLAAGSGGVAVTNESSLAEKLFEMRDRLPAQGSFSGLRQRAEILLHKHVLRPSLYWFLYGLSKRFDPSYRARTLAQELQTEIEDAGVKLSAYQLREGMLGLSRLRELAAHRRRCCADYADALQGEQSLQQPAAQEHAPLYYYPVLTSRKDHLLDEARRRQIELIAWPVRTPIFPVEDKQELVKYGYQLGTCPVAERVAQELLGLPTHQQITAKVRARVIALVRSCAR